MSLAATVERHPTYGGVLRLSFTTVEAALAAMRKGDTITIIADR